MIKIYSVNEEPKRINLNSLINQNFTDEKFDRCILTNLNMNS